MVCASTARPYVNRDARDSFMMVDIEVRMGRQPDCHSMWFGSSDGMLMGSIAPYLYNIGGNDPELSRRAPSGIRLLVREWHRALNPGQVKNAAYIGYWTPTLPKRHS